jgi:hypothetical protein
MESCKESQFLERSGRHFQFADETGLDLSCGFFGRRGSLYNFIGLRWREGSRRSGLGEGLIGQRIIPKCSIATRGEPNHTAHLFLNLSFVPQISNHFPHESRIQALPRQGQKLPRIISVALG